MTFLQHLKFSNLKFITGIFFALFVLSACAAGDSAPPPDAPKCTEEQELAGDNSCVPKLTIAVCQGAGFKGYDDEVAECISYTKAECDSQNYNGLGRGGICASFTTSSCQNLGYYGVGFDGKCTSYSTNQQCKADGFITVNSDGKCDNYSATSQCIADGYKDLNATDDGCVGFNTAECNENNFNGVDNTGRCIAYTTDAECVQNGFKGLDGTTGACVFIGAAECQADGFYSANAKGECIDYTTAQCKAQGSFQVGADGKCVAYTNELDCNADGYKGYKLAGGGCDGFTLEECHADGKNVNSLGICIAYTASDCIAANRFFETDTTQCVVDNYTPKVFADFDTDEYKKSSALHAIKTAQAYVNIENLIDADNNTATTIKNGGAGQIVAIAANTGFSARNREFKKGGTNAGAFLSVHDVDQHATTKTYTHDASISTDGKLLSAPSSGGDCKNNCIGTRYASLIGAGSGAGSGSGDGNMHGIAYDVSMKGIKFSGAHRDTIRKALPLGAGADTIVMLHAWTSVVLERCNHNNIEYDRPYGNNMHPSNCSNSGQVDSNLHSTELTAWNEATSGTNKTIMVFPNGDQGFNSETGRVKEKNQRKRWVTVKRIIATSGDHNIPSYHAALPALGHGVNAGRWLTVVALDSSSGEIRTSSNGCGIAMGFCLGARGNSVYVAKEGNAYQTHSGTDVAAATVAGGLALLKGAFPKATPEQLTRLVLETSDYIPLDNKTTKDHPSCGSNGGSSGDDCYATDAYSHGNGKTEDENERQRVCKKDGDSSMVKIESSCSAGYSHADHPTNGGKLYVNATYGYGRLNLEAATTSSVALSYVTASNNTSIGALWKDTNLSLSSHFGGGLDNIKLGIGDEYGRHFTAKAIKTSIAPLAVTMDDYLTNWQLLGNNIQSRSLGINARANYSHTGVQDWMSLHYTSGKATSRIAFQESYKTNPLVDIGASSILRANNIRPASQNIGMMDVDYRLGSNLTLSSYVARGEYDTGYEFDELGTDIDVRYKKSSLNIGIGNVREHDQFLGTNTAGGYALKAPTVSRFTDVTYGHNVGKKFNIYANYIKYETDVDMVYSEFASIDGLQADQYQVGIKGRSLLTAHDNLNIALITKLGVTDGVLNQNTVRGYTADGEFNNVSQSYDLAVTERHQQFEITYQGRIYQHSQDKVSLLKNNRFFTTVRVDRNLNHQEDASQTEVISGINARF